jgi:putative flavoprotein involved in K+ transport
MGVEHGARPARRNWSDLRQLAGEFLDEDPQVLIVGAGQSGLSLAARLGRLDIRTLVVEKNERVGDNWRKRYPSLSLHDPVWADHLPYLHFPPNWPIFTPKDKLADWLEGYASAMELNVWTATTIGDCSYDEKTRRWTVQVCRGDGTARTVCPHHLVIATGGDSAPKIPEFEGIHDFEGSVMHSGAYGGGLAWKGMNTIVVGSGTSAHDIAQDLYEQGAACVTMVQRSSTLVISSAQYLAMLGEAYAEAGLPVDDADLIDASLPFRLRLELHKALTLRSAEADREILDGLRKRGFQLDFGPDGSGIIGKPLVGGGGLYIDVGASQLIVDGKIALKHGVEIERFVKDGLVFEDGTFVPADLAILATGYSKIRETAKKLVGEALDKCVPVFGFDEEGEARPGWGRSGHEGLWFMAGNLKGARYYSKFLALQIKAIEEGVFDTTPLEDRG